MRHPVECDKNEFHASCGPLWSIANDAIVLIKSLWVFSTTHTHFDSSVSWSWAIGHEIHPHTHTHSMEFDCHHRSFIDRNRRWLCVSIVSGKHFRPFQRMKYPSSISHRWQKWRLRLDSLWKSSVRGRPSWLIYSKLLVNSFKTLCSVCVWVAHRTEALLSDLIAHAIQWTEAKSLQFLLVRSYICRAAKRFPL